MPEPGGKHLPLQFSPEARAAGLRFLYRGPQMLYFNALLNTYFQHTVYDGVSLWAVFQMPLSFGLAAFVLQLPFSIAKDIKRRRQMKYGRRLKGPPLPTPQEFNKVVEGDGISFKTVESEKMMRIPQRAEGQHIELMGDTGAGKTTLTMQVLRQIQSRRHSAIVYDPTCEFGHRFHNKDRGDEHC
jgi:Type IV secretion-system coupling protein DNA-binding domain